MDRGIKHGLGHFHFPRFSVRFSLIYEESAQRVRSSPKRLGKYQVRPETGQGPLILPNENELIYFRLVSCRCRSLLLSK